MTPDRDDRFWTLIPVDQYGCRSLRVVGPLVDELTLVVPAGGTDAGGTDRDVAALARVLVDFGGRWNDFPVSWKNAGKDDKRAALATARRFLAEHQKGEEAT